jgi:hypothetical protein
MSGFAPKVRAVPSRSSAPSRPELRPLSIVGDPAACRKFAAATNCGASCWLLSNVSNRAFGHAGSLSIASSRSRRKFE